MLNLYKVLKDFVPIGTQLYIEELDDIVYLKALNDENSPNAIECIKNGRLYYFNKNNFCTNYINNNYSLLPSKQLNDWYFIINIKFGEPVMFKTKYVKEWMLGKYCDSDDIIINNIHYSETDRIIPIKYFDFETF